MGSVSESAMKLMAMAQGLNSDDESSATSENENDDEEEVVNMPETEGVVAAAPKLKDRSSTNCEIESNAQPVLLNRTSMVISNNVTPDADNNDVPQMSASRTSNQVQHVKKISNNKQKRRKKKKKKKKKKKS